MNSVVVNKKRTFSVSRELLRSLSSLLFKVENDTVDNKLLTIEGFYLIYRLYFDSSEPAVWKLKTFGTTNTNPKEIQGEREIIEFLSNKKIIKLNHLLPQFGYSYLKIPTKRYHIVKDKIWIDFVGWTKNEDVPCGIFAICSMIENHNIPELLLQEEMKQQEEMINKTLFMLFHHNRALFNKITTESDLAFVKLGDPFEEYDQFLGLIKAFEEQ
jgi:hypothetical protein